MKYTIFQGNIFDCLPKIDAESVDLVITSPPYWGLRDYGVTDQLGREPTMEAYLENTMKWVKEVWRVLKPTGSFVLNIGDCFCGSGGGGTTESTMNPNNRESTPKNRFTNLKSGIYKAKQLLSVSSFAYCKIISETDFVCRGEHIWLKPNMPTPIRSRLKHSHEKLFWFVKDADKYYFNEKAWMKDVKESSNERFKYGQHLSAGHENINVSATSAINNTEHNRHLIGTQTIEHSWRIVSVGEKQKGFELHGKGVQEHIAPFPEELVKPYVESMVPEGGIVCDVFLGSGTILKIARDLRINGIGIELNPKYVEYSKKRINWNNGIDGNEYELRTV